MRFQGSSWLGYNSLSLKTGSRGFSSTTIIYVLRSYHHTILDISWCIDILSLKVGTEEPKISCTKCPPGYYSKVVGASNCTACSYFEYQSKEGGNECFLLVHLFGVVMITGVQMLLLCKNVLWFDENYTSLEYGVMQEAWKCNVKLVDRHATDYSVWLALPYCKLLYRKWYTHHGCILHYSYIGEVEIPFI